MRGKITLHIYWEKTAKKYAEDNGCVNYMID